MLAALSAVGRHAHDAPELDQDMASVMQLIGLDPETYDEIAADLATLVERGEAAGLDRGSLPHVAQAYVRAVGRIVTVESLVALDTLRAVDADEREELMLALIDAMLPVSNRGFDVLHRLMLWDALAEASPWIEDRAALERMAVGMVDLVGSTKYLSSVDSSGLEQLVDAMFNAGQGAISGRPAHIVKYVGDGVFFGATEVSVVADAATQIIERLEAALPLRARGGISYGFVVQRAGDVFGMPINLAQALTKAARPGTVLLSADAAEVMPAERRGRIYKRRLPHAALGEQRVATLRT
jgi:adenylate cyclase